MHSAGKVGFPNFITRAEWESKKYNKAFRKQKRGGLRRVPRAIASISAPELGVDRDAADVAVVGSVSASRRSISRPADAHANAHAHAHARTQQSRSAFAAAAARADSRR